MEKLSEKHLVKHGTGFNTFDAGRYLITHALSYHKFGDEYKFKRKHQTNRQTYFKGTPFGCANFE